MIAVERAGLELVREGRSAVEAEPGRTVNRATIAKLANSHMSMGSVDFGQIAPMVGESELLVKEERMYLSQVMPPKLECHHWILAFSTSNQGNLFSGIDNYWGAARYVAQICQKALDNSSSNNFYLFQLKSTKEVTKKLSMVKKLKNMKKSCRIVLFS